MHFKLDGQMIELRGLRDLHKLIHGAGHYEEHKLAQLLKVPQFGLCLRNCFIFLLVCYLFDM